MRRLAEILTPIPGHVSEILTRPATCLRCPFSSDLRQAPCGFSRYLSHDCQVCLRVVEATRRVVRFADGAVGGFADTVLGRVKESTSIEWNRSSWVEVVVDEWIGVAVGGGCAR